MSLWLINSMVNFVLQHCIVGAKNLWFSTIAKDVVITASILSIITIAQMEVFNSCWCNSSAMFLGSNAYIAFGPFSDEHWNNSILPWCAVPSLAFIVAMGFIIPSAGKMSPTVIDKSWPIESIGSRLRHHTRTFDSGVRARSNHRRTLPAEGIPNSDNGDNASNMLSVKS